jgi:hypothetical protein
MATVALLDDLVRVDAVVREALDVATPGRDVRSAADERRLVEDDERVVLGHEPAEARDVAAVDRVDKAGRDSPRARNRPRSPPA